jgi:hypothetical protein
MNDSESERNAKAIDEASATLAAAAERLTNEIEPAFVYQIEARQTQASGEDE